MRSIRFLLLGLFIFPIFAESIDGKYWGEIKDFSSGYTFEAFYSFDKNNYDLEIDLTGVDSALSIPQQYCVKDKKKNFYFEKGEYEIKNIGKFNFILFKNTSAYNVAEKLCFLRFENHFLFLDGTKTFFQSFSNYFDPSPVYKIKNIKVSSYLREGNILYNAENFKNIQNQLRPWVEGVDGDGVDEWLELTFDYPSDQSKKLCFLISNGYVDPKRLDLFFANNRVKRLHVTCKELKVDHDILLQDSPDFQHIEIPKNQSVSGPITVRFVIKETYKGTKYEDTCLNFVLPIKK